MPARNTALLAAAALLAILAPRGARAAQVPFVEDFATDAAAWRDNAQGDLAWQAAGGPDGSGYASAEFNYFGFTSPFGGGPVIFRANDAQDASGDAFVGDWIAAGVEEIRAWVRHDTGEDLTYFVRFATSQGFPGAVIEDDAAVPSGAWTQIVIEVDPQDCQLEGVPACEDVLTQIGNFQIGTLPPESLTLVDAAFAHDVDEVALLAAPEPAQAALAVTGALVHAAARRRRRGCRGAISTFN
jgi:hypothetical protein